MKIYIGCGLTHVPRELFKSYCSFVHRLAARLQTDHQVKYALRDSDPQLAEKPYADRARLCYVWDRRMVEEADTMIAEVSFPATGLGVELQIAESKGIPLILCYSDLGNNRAESVVYETPDQISHELQIGKGYASLMVLGLPNVLQVIQYANAEDGIDLVSSAVSLLQRKS